LTGNASLSWNILISFLSLKHQHQYIADCHCIKNKYIFTIKIFLTNCSLGWMLLWTDSLYKSKFIRYFEKYLWTANENYWWYLLKNIEEEQQVDNCWGLVLTIFRAVTVQKCWSKWTSKFFNIYLFCITVSYAYYSLYDWLYIILIYICVYKMAYMYIINSFVIYFPIFFQKGTDI
jgi:hypothetical protein